MRLLNPQLWLFVAIGSVLVLLLTRQLRRKNATAPSVALLADSGCLLAGWLALVALRASCILTSMSMDDGGTMRLLFTGVQSLAILLVALAAMHMLRRYSRESVTVSAAPRRVLARVLTALVVVSGVYATLLNVLAPVYIPLAMENSVLMAIGAVYSGFDAVAPIVFWAIVLCYAVFWLRSARIRFVLR